MQERHYCFYGYRPLEKNKTWWPWPALAKFLSSLSPLFTALWLPPIDKRAKQTVPALPSQPKPGFTIGQDNQGQFSFSRDEVHVPASYLRVSTSCDKCRPQRKTFVYHVWHLVFLTGLPHLGLGLCLGVQAGSPGRGEQHGLPGLLQHWTPDRDNRRLWKMALVRGAVRSTWQLLHNAVAPRARIQISYGIKYLFRTMHNKAFMSL